MKDKRQILKNKIAKLNRRKISSEKRKIKHERHVLSTKIKNKKYKIAWKKWEQSLKDKSSVKEEKITQENFIDDIPTNTA